MGSSPVVFLLKAQDTDHKINNLLTFKQVWQTQLDDSPDAQRKKNCQLVKMMWGQGQTLSSSPSWLAASIKCENLPDPSRRDGPGVPLRSLWKLPSNYAFFAFFQCRILSAFFYCEPFLLRKNNANYLSGLYYAGSS